MKLPGDPWNNRWSSFYGITWNFSMEFHGKYRCRNFHGNWCPMFSMEFHGKCPHPPCKYFLWKSTEKFPWNSMEIDVLILHGIPWRIFHGNPRNSTEVFHPGSKKISLNPGLNLTIFLGTGPWIINVLGQS